MKPTPCFAIVGTDTEVGKTMIACGLARALTDAGHSVMAIKPVETGCSEAQADNQDGTMLARATGQTEPASALFKFPAPVAPPVAADLVGERFEYPELIQAVKETLAGDHVKICEGAGGLLSPLTWTATMVEICIDLGATAIVVAANRLGVINHTLLTIQVLRQANIPIGAVILNRGTSVADSSCLAPLNGTDASLETNLSSLQRLLPDVAVIEMPWAENMIDAARHLSEFATSLMEGAS